MSETPEDASSFVFEIKPASWPEKLTVLSSGSVEHYVRPMWLHEGDTAKSTSPVGVDFGQKNNLHLLEVQWCQQNKSSSSHFWKRDLKITLKQKSLYLLLLGVLRLFGETLFPVQDWYPITEIFTLLGPSCCVFLKVCSSGHPRWSRSLLPCRMSVVSNDFGKCKAWSELSLQKNGKPNPQCLAGKIWPS